MTKLIIPLSLILVGLLLGQLLKFSAAKKTLSQHNKVEKLMKTIQMIALLLMNPIISMGAFWSVTIEDTKLIIIPLLGLSALVLGGVLGLAASKIMGLGRKQSASLLLSASFTNIGTFGGFISYVFFGEVSYAFVSMYKLFEELFYYAIGYPIAKALGKSDGSKHNLLKLILDPYILVAFFSLGMELVLNLSGLDRPAIYSKVNDILIPLSTLLLVTSVGFKMQVTAVSGYLKESLAVSLIKFILVPIIITSLAYYLGIGQISDGLALKVIFVLTAMPPAFNSLIPPQLYDLDGDLANSSWLVNTGLLVVVVPVLYMIQSNFL